MSDEEDSEPCFLEDVRVKFVEEKVCELLRLQRPTWEKSAVSEEFQTPLRDFLEKERASTFWPGVCTPSAAAVMHSGTGDGHILTRMPALQIYVLFTLILHCVFSKVWVPLLSNYNNQQMWPNLLSADIIRHVESICSKTSVVRGQVFGETILPLPLFFFLYPLRCEHYDRTLAHTIETQVINWTNLIQKILKEDPSDLLLTGCNPGPSAELKFWASRKTNIGSIYCQLQSPAVQMMAKMLEVMNSSYSPTIGTLNENEARDIDIHLQPLQAQLSQLEREGFPSMETNTPALFHLLFLLWTNCQAYQRPARIVVLLQELCNMFIEQASAYLSDDLLLRDDSKESLQMVERVIKVFRCFQDSYQTQREKLANQVKHAPWDFPSAMIFSRFNQFLKRLLQLEDLFKTVLYFERLEKLEFGGIKGKLHNIPVSRQLSFIKLCLTFFFCHQDFENEFLDFKRRVVDLDFRLANLLCLVFNDCSGLESALKTLIIFGPFLEKREIQQIFSPNFILLQHHFQEELDQCKHLFKSQLEQKESGVMKNMTHTSGALKWAKMLRDRLQSSWEKLRLLLDMSVNEEVV
uniref:Dynein heavy chain tail domain-containing protein n=1 Tax=Salarias fasciatus TaxID=181472 RepID=A0A672GZT9_SALFA